MDVSLIIPVYNARQFIEKCMESVRSQVFKGSLECIFIDDCSNDETINKIEDFIRDEKYQEKKQKNIKYHLYHQEYNQGPSAARNRGIKESKGKYLFFLDADDEITPDCIETLYSLADSHNLDYVQGVYDNKYGMSSFYSSNEKGLIFDRATIKRSLLNYNIIPYTPHNRLVLRRMIIENKLFFNEEIRVREDFLWMSFVAKHVTRMGYSDRVTYFRGYNENSLTHNVNIEREIKGYRVLIETMCANIDSFLIGEQKTLILDALIMCIESGYYHNSQEKNYLINLVKKQNCMQERVLLRLYIIMPNSKWKKWLLHALIRLYKINDR